MDGRPLINGAGFIAGGRREGKRKARFVLARLRRLEMQSPQVLGAKVNSP